MFLERACVGDGELRREVESLLAFEEQKDNSFIEVSAVEVAARALSESLSAFVVGKRVGPYKIIEEIGRGGMGAVYLAERADEEFQRTVAVKLIKRGMDTDAVLRRFRNERQILARLDHANIARLYDGGTTDDGLPYFVMEYAEGQSILEYAARHSLSVNERLDLFKQVCSAVAYAHERRIVHRDLKPSNILVTEEGVPKLLDFGIAKLLDPYEEGDDDLTATALRALTPEYACPEQVRGLRVTTVSDIYSLGVVLYELLTGRRPYQANSRSSSSVEELICGATPLKPSLAAVTAKDAPACNTAGGESPDSTETNGARASRGERLRRRLKGDLDNIVLMAMRKEPGRRYASAGQLREDIERHLSGRPVAARSDGFGYRASKFIKRHHAAAVMVAVVVFVAASLSFGFYLWAKRNATRAAAPPRPRFDNAVRLTFDIADDNYAQWSPDGEAIYFESERERDGREVPYVMKWDGGDQRRASPDRGIGGLIIPSPDGKRIAYTRKDGEWNDLVVADADGGHEKALTRELRAGRIKWSPDGRQLAFNSPLGRDVEIFTVNADGSGLKNVSNYPGLNVDPSWSPDGRRIAFTSRRDAALRIYSMDADDGANQTRITDGPGNDRTPAWSPDGRRIAFVSDRVGRDEIFLMDASGANQTRLTYSPQEDQEPAWSRDGKRIAYTTNEGGVNKVRVIDAP